MKRILFLMPILYCGGSEKQIRFLIDGLLRNGCQVSVIVESSSLNMKNHEDQFVESHSSASFIFLNCSAVAAKYGNILLKYIFKFISLVKLCVAIRREIKEKCIDVVMVTNLTGLVLQPMYRFMGARTIYNERNPGVGITSNVGKRFLLRRCDFLVCNSKAASVVMTEKLGRFVPVMNNGIEYKPFFNKMIKSDPFEIIVPARISKVKNQLVVLKALVLMKKKAKLHISFAGVVEDANYMLLLKRYIEENNLTEFVDFLGFVANMDEIYKQADLLVLPSFEEGTPNVLLEAFMHGVLPLASNITMNSDCVANKDFLFNPKDAEMLSEKVLWAMDMDSSCRTQTLMKNREFVVANYGVEAMVFRYDSLLWGKKR